MLALCPLCLANKTILFYFTQNSVSKNYFGVMAERPNSSPEKNVLLVLPISFKSSFISFRQNRPMKIVSLLLVQEPRFKNAEFCILNYVCIQSLNKIYLALPWHVLWSSDAKN